MRFPTWGTNIAIALVAFLVAGVGAELGLRVLVPPTTGYFVLLPGTDRTFHPQSALMPGVEGPARYRVNAFGIRGRPFGPDDHEYRILAIGGSTTECAYLDEAEVWTALVERDLGSTRDGRRVFVGNLGRSGRTARDHVVQLKYLLPQYPRIDVALVLVGVNDLMHALAQGPDYRRPPPLTDPAAERLQLRRAFVRVPGALEQPGTDALLAGDSPWWKATAVWQLAKRARMAYVARTDQGRQDVLGTTISDWRAARTRGEVVDATPPTLDEALAEYRDNLLLLSGIARAGGVQLVLVTQPALWQPDNSPEEQRRLWMGGIGDFPSTPARRYYSPRVLRLVMDAYNRVLLEVCRDAPGALCLDAASALPWDTTTLYDDVHFTEAGARQLAAYLGRELRARPPFE